MKITNTMVLALLQKGMSYEMEDLEMEYEVPMNIFGIGDEDSDNNMVIRMTVKSMKMEITND